MLGRLKLISLSLLAPLLLVGCAFSPGKFTSTLTVLADRSFTFTYKGEIVATDIMGDVADGSGEALTTEEEAKDTTETATLTNANIVRQEEDSAKPAEESAEDKAEQAAKFAAIAESLTKEAGYRSVVHKGDGVFEIDYAISGNLSHGFMWPYNLDAGVIFPFIVLEVRGGDTVRIKAPAFGDTKKMPGQDAGKKASVDMDGIFTLITDGEIVSQNNEDGAKADGKRRTITWKANPNSKEEPMAVLRLAPLK